MGCWLCGEVQNAGDPGQSDARCEPDDLLTKVLEFAVVRVFGRGGSDADPVWLVDSRTVEKVLRGPGGRAAASDCHRVEAENLTTRSEAVDCDVSRVPR